VVRSILESNNVPFPSPNWCHMELRGATQGSAVSAKGVGVVWWLNVWFVKFRRSANNFGGNSKDSVRTKRATADEKRPTRNLRRPKS
jgi:hypothetical protein